MNEQVLVNMLIEMSREVPNDMEYGGKVRLLLNKYIEKLED